ncbi:hypothetical protein LSPH24S_06934 [Lysinibacillus sphaericus]
MEVNIRYDTRKVHRVNLAIISILAISVICWPNDTYKRNLCSYLLVWR